MISIVGAGPVGSYLASLLKDEVHVFEEHSQIGLPVQCTGITTAALGEIIRIRKEFVVNTIGKARIFAPDGSSIDFRLKNKNIILNRMLFDRHLAEKAMDKGARFHLNHKFIGMDDGKVSIKHGNKTKTINAEVLVGADGPLSHVAKSAGLFGRRRFMIGIQARVSINTDPDCAEFYVINGGYGWVVPESSSIARIGVAVYKQPNVHFKSLLEKRAKRCKIREYQSGLIPLYNPALKIQKDNVFLVGDAATFLKASTGGGIVHGLMSAEELATSLNHDKDYTSLCNARFKKDLRLHLLIRGKMDRFSENDYGGLVRLFRQERLKKVLEEHDRDFPSRFIFKLLLREPRLLLFGV